MSKDIKGINEDDDFMKNILKSVDTEKTNIDIMTYRGAIKEFITKINYCEDGVSANAKILRSYLQQLRIFPNPEDRTETLYANFMNVRINFKLLPKIIGAWLDIIKTKPESVDSYTFNRVVDDWLEKYPPFFTNQKTYVVSGMCELVKTVDKLLKSVLCSGIAIYGFNDFDIYTIESIVNMHDMLLDDLCNIVTKYAKTDPDMCESEMNVIYDKYLARSIWVDEYEDKTHQIIADLKKQQRHVIGRKGSRSRKISH